jgi:hypothetical protein
MSVAENTREYLSRRIAFLEIQVESVSALEGPLKHELKSMITELQQTLNVLNGGKSIFQKVEEVEIA